MRYLNIIVLLGHLLLPMICVWMAWAVADTAHTYPSSHAFVRVAPVATFLFGISCAMTCVAFKRRWISFRQSP